MIQGLLKIEPHFVEKIWGGNISERWYGLPQSLNPIGEIWSACATEQFANDLPTANSTLDQWLIRHSDDYPMSYDQLPFRISIIDAKDDLSVQVHPTEAYAHKTGLSSGLSEAWIILETTPGAKIQLGHQAILKEELEEMIRLQQWNSLLRYEPVVKGEVFYIEAGTMHAIGKGILVYEISQAVDVTYRIYDYDRVDFSTKKKRELHVEQALDVLTVPDKGGHRVECPITVYESYRHSQPIITRFFTVDVYDVEKLTDLTLDNWGFLTVISSQGTINGVSVNTGDTYLISNRHRNLIIDGNVSFIFASEGKFV